uniref:Zinc finger protein 280D n=1 Tax=Myripristis murdjan TaxID=586833 RepID=A0A667YC14_9TELE
MSELFMECEEEELEPWQKQVPQVNLVDDDDDEPIFVGELSMSQHTFLKEPVGVEFLKLLMSLLPINHCPVQSMPSDRQFKITFSAASLVIFKQTEGSSQMVLPLTVPAKGVNTAPSSLTTITPQPVIVNNQGFIVTSPQLSSNTEFITSLGKQYPPGTSITIVPAGQQHLLQQVTPATLIPGVVHRPQVQQINNNVVTLSNVQSPAIYSTPSNQLQAARPNSQPIQIFSVPIKAQGNNRGETKVIDLVENGTFRKKCPKCKEEFLLQEAMKTHMMSCCANLVESVFPSTPDTTSVATSKRIMLVSDFYYGRFDGDGHKQQAQKTNTTFKCQSCLKVLKNNIRFMNHMKHHLELEKQNSESWESHTTCQHCYRQYMTPFQLQCHIESAHSPFESSTNCKICELAFESEQVLLEHMKDNHKPGEMPYVCQVCNFRSSFFSEVETHFRSVHENTKDLLCPFCLKVLRSSHIYMQHYMKHQKKGIHRCGKCRLNFLTYKEKLEHKTNVHKTFRKPKALEGLPPGTKVTIRASLTGKMPVLPSSPDRSAVNVSPDTLSCKQQTKAPINVIKSKSNAAAAGKAKPPQIKKQERQIDDFFSHYPMISNCGACKYSTSCKVSIGNHMIRFHSTITKNRFWKMENRKNQTKSKLTLICLNCDLIVDASGGEGGDLMSRHLTDRPSHVCKVISESSLCGSTSGPAEKLKETDTKQVERDASEGASLVGNGATVEHPEASEQLVPAVDQDKTSKDTNRIENSPERELKQSSPTTACASHEESLANSEGLDVREQASAPLQPPISPTVLEQETG